MIDSRVVILTFFALSWGLVADPALAAAQGIPLPARKQDVFSANENAAAMAEKQKRQSTLKANLEKVDDEIAGLKRSMVKTARDIKGRERAMTNIENKITDLQKKRTGLQKKLQRDERGLSDLAGALIRLRHVPPEVLMARPGAPLDTAQAAMVLRGAAEPIRAHAAALYQDLAVLNEVELTLKTEQSALKDESKKILTDQTKLQDLIRRRESAYARLQKDLKSEQEDLEKLAAAAADFRELVEKLEARNRDLAAAASRAQENEQSPSLRQKENGAVEKVSLPRRAPPKVDEKILRSFGDVQMPISGLVRLGFGDINELGATSEGWKMEGRAGGVVVAPINGIVRYKGFFKNYGNMIIIEHGKKYHSLVAGLAKIDTVVGQSVEAGEPIGTLGTNRTARPSLYYELRHGGKPVDPATLFPNAG